MCQFEGTPVIKVHEDVTEDKPIIAYKILDLRPGTKVHFSPLMYSSWLKRRLSSDSLPDKRQFGVTGIYAFKNRKEAANNLLYSNSRRIVRLALWGRVVEHGLNSLSMSGKDKMINHGFRAQHAKILRSEKMLAPSISYGD